MPDTVLDSHALLTFFRAEKGDDKVKHLLERAGEHNKFLHMTEVNYAEVKYIIMRKDGPDRWAKISSELPILPITFHPATRALADTAANIKSRHSLSLADAFAAALAKERKAELVTGDREFKALEGEIKIGWLK